MDDLRTFMMPRRSEIENQKSEITNHPGPIAQLGARLNGIEEAGGSNPPGSTEQMQPLSSFGGRFVFTEF